ncbi:MAG: hypothetical protein Q8L64_04570 [bacterium]|nr:hypothetical protein [bacterium]
MKTRNKDQACLSDLLLVKLGENPAFTTSPDIHRRIVESIVVLENAGRDWLSAVRSKRFVQDAEMVGRILAYPEPPPHAGSEVRKLEIELGVESRRKELCLMCGYFSRGFMDDDLTRRAWIYAAEIAEKIRAGHKAVDEVTDGANTV